MWDSSRWLLLMDRDKLVTSGRTSLEAGTKGLQKTLHSPALGTLRHEVSLLCVGKLLFVQDGVGCEGLRLTGEEEKGKGGQCLWTQQRYTTKGKRFKRKGRFLGTCWGGGWAEADGAAPLSCSFALKTKKVHGDDCEWKDVKSRVSGSVQWKPIVARPPATGEGLPTPGSWDPTPQGCGAAGEVQEGLEPRGSLWPRRQRWAPRGRRVPA